MEDTKSNYLQIINLFEKYSDIQKSQRLRGLNDLNIFTTLFKKSDEVKLHSSFIHFLLDTYSNHYQQDLFLGLFLRFCGLNDGFIDLESAQVYKEFDHIDLYITDGVNHIIIENKLEATDQPQQIQRYIDAIKDIETDSADLSERLIVIYLSLGREPTALSLGRFKINGDCITSTDESYRYIHITYKIHIFNWIEECLKQVSNITNLSVIISQYRDVIRKLYGNYQGNVMSLHEFLESQPDKMEKYRTLSQIVSEYSKLKKSVMEKFWDETLTRLGEISVNNSWILEVDDLNRLVSGTKFGFPLRLKITASDKYCFAFEYHEPDYHKPLWGILSANDEAVLNSREYLHQEYASLPEALNKENKFWMKHGFFMEGDMFEWVIQQKSISDASIYFVDQFQEVCMPCMEYLSLVQTGLDLKNNLQ